MKESIFSKKKILLLGSGELGKELVIESKRLGLEVVAIDRYEKAPAMQVADYSRVIDMGDKNILKNVIKEFKPDYVVPEIEALSIEALKELEDEGFNIVPNARTVEITMNRDKIRDLASKDLKIKTAKFDYIFEFDDLEKKADEIGFPLLLKPLMSSSGKGQSLVETKNDLQNAWKQAQANSRGKVKGVIIEEFIPGREIQAAIIGPKKLGAIELKPKRKFYDYQAKYNPKAKTKHIIPVHLSKKKYEQIMKISSKAHSLVGCRGVTRSDFKYYRGKFYLLEINTQPGMTKLSLVPEIAAFRGISFIKLIELILKDASTNK